ncbi:MAG: SpoIID/LytB domain-containing protein [Flavobacteriales bacterium]|nr:SpoIID/LytB domain-containing protein [Flavobacteriales bacterium]
MPRLALLVLTCLLAIDGHAQDNTLMHVGIYRDKALKELMVMSQGGGTEVFIDGVRKGELMTTDGMKVAVVEGRLQARSLAFSFNSAKRIELRPHHSSGHLRITGVRPKVAERTYDGWMAITVQGGDMHLVNTVAIEDYVAGVVQSESGKDKALEYYKLQAVSCRTYALVNKRKHLADGFEVCDGVHCQVYRGHATLPDVLTATAATTRMVVVDARIRLIHATFHSNCGGETMNAEDVWSKPEGYLVSTVDTFCVAAPHATWQRTIERAKWLGYLHDRHGVNTGDSTMVQAATRFEPNCRERYLGTLWPLVPLDEVRADWKFNSAYFSIRPEGDKLLFEGRGFGHGVGLCQEGAMRMAEQGYPFTDILHHYFADVHLVDLGAIDFFRDGE